MSRPHPDRLRLSAHAAARCAERNIRVSQVHLAVAYGRVWPLPSGEVIYYMDPVAAGVAQGRGLAVTCALEIAAVVDPTGTEVVAAYRCDAATMFRRFRAA